MLYTYYFSQKQLELIQETAPSSGLELRETFVNGIQYTEKSRQTSDSVCNWEDSEVVFLDTDENIGKVTFGRLH